MADVRALMFQVRDRRLGLGRTQMDVASEIGVTQGALGHWESGRRTPSLASFAALVDELGYQITLTSKES